METVFISSIQKELAEERRALKDYIEGDALLRSLWIGAGDFPDSERVRWQESYFQAGHVLG